MKSFFLLILTTILFCVVSIWAYAGNGLYPITSTYIDNQTGESIKIRGTATLITHEYSKRFFLVTAAHVVGGSNLTIDFGAGEIPLVYNFRTTDTLGDIEIFEIAQPEHATVFAHYNPTRKEVTVFPHVLPAWQTVTPNSQYIPAGKDFTVSLGLLNFVAVPSFLTQSAPDMLSEITSYNWRRPLYTASHVDSLSFGMTNPLSGRQAFAIRSFPGMSGSPLLSLEQGLVVRVTALNTGYDRYFPLSFYSSAKSYTSALANAFSRINLNLVKAHWKYQNCTTYLDIDDGLIQENNPRSPFQPAGGKTIADGGTSCNDSKSNLESLKTGVRYKGKSAIAFQLHPGKVIFADISSLSFDFLVDAYLSTSFQVITAEDDLQAILSKRMASNHSGGDLLKTGATLDSLGTGASDGFSLGYSTIQLLEDGLHIRISVKKPRTDMIDFKLDRHGRVVGRAQSDFESTFTVTSQKNQSYIIDVSDFYFTNLSTNKNIMEWPAIRLRRADSWETRMLSFIRSPK